MIGKLIEYSLQMVCEVNVYPHRFRDIAVQRKKRTAAFVDKMTLTLEKVSSCFFPWSSTVFTCFSNAFSSEDYANLVCFIDLFWSSGNFSLPVRYLYIFILPDDNVDILQFLL